MVLKTEKSSSVGDLMGGMRRRVIVRCVVRVVKRIQDRGEIRVVVAYGWELEQCAWSWVPLVGTVGDDGVAAGDVFVIASSNMRISITYLVVD
jgi:hypothetical protein